MCLSLVPPPVFPRKLVVFLNRILMMAGFVCLCIPVLAGPWLFGAWEMWWFWPLMMCLFLAAAFFATRLLIQARIQPYEPPHHDSPHVAACFLMACLPFMAYALVRALMAEVWMDAERSFLLFLGPALIGIHVAFGLNKALLKILYVLVVVNLALLGLYGVLNHLGNGSKMVMWLPGYPQYVCEVRATGSYFCPDHFAGIMELALCLSLGLLLDRRARWHWKLPAALLSLLAVAGIVMSKSRGGGLTVLVIAAAALVWGFSQWETRKRWVFRGIAAAGALVALIIFCIAGRTYIERFGRWFAWNRAKEKPLPGMISTITNNFQRTSRGRMFGGALRAWRTSPVFGIGPGMHQNLWPHFAATADGNRESGKWPSETNQGFWSDFVHSDWLQLLEEYGLLGLLLFLPPAFILFYLLLKARSTHYATALGSLLSFVCMAFHSLGDFNLQMPATGWLFGTILAIPIARSLTLYRKLQ